MPNKINTETKIINIRRHPNWRKEGAVYIGRGSKWGNSWQIGRDGTRKEVLKKYRDWFYGWLEDERFMAEVLELKGKTLACYCKPAACHGDIIAEFLDSFIEDNTDNIEIDMQKYPRSDLT